MLGVIGEPTGSQQLSRQYGNTKWRILSKRWITNRHLFAF